MPAPGKAWRHVTIGALNSWLPGDDRGFRSRGHKVHSSGDHRHPPPPDEHAGLRRHARRCGGEPVIIPRRLRPTIGTALVEHFRKLGHRLLVLSVGGMHVHAQIELPADRAEAKREVGRAKRVASIKVTCELPGRLWARGCGLELVNDPRHQRNTYEYIARHVDQGAWVWTHDRGVIGWDSAPPG